MQSNPHSNSSTLSNPQSNPLLAPVDTLIDYRAVKPEHIQPAIELLLEKARAAVDAAADPSLPATWKAVVSPIDDATDPLWRVWTIVGHLKSVQNTPALREAVNAMLGPVTEFATWVGLHEGLFTQYLRLQQSEDFNSWPEVRRRVIDLSVRDFRLGGVELKGQARERYAEIAERESQVAQKFSENVLDANDGWSLVLDDVSRLDGIPADVIEGFQAMAQADPEIDQSGTPKYKLNLKMPSYLPVMQYAKDRELRYTLYKAYATLASDQGDPQFDNSSLIEESLSLRAESAQLLGFKSFAELRLETRMADTPDEVLTFLRQLAGRALPYARKDLDDLRAYARDHLGLAELEPWDVAYASEHLRQARYDYSEDEVKQYFTEPKVVQGLFDLAQRLFSVRIVPTTLSLWRDDVSAARIESEKGELIGHLIIDLYAREGKQGGAWVSQERSRRRTDTGLQTPVVYLTCNFAKGRDGKPSLLTHDDVITLFHEAGHALHALLDEIDEPGASAFSAVEWDAIELPSQFMENFCWEYEVLKDLTSHIETGDVLPKSLYDKLKAARNFQSGMQTVRQIEFALFDMLLHQQEKGLAIGDVMATLEAVRQEVAVLIPPTWHRFAHAFTHLFAGGYGAGYYSYKWAEVLSADAFAAFEEAASTLDPQTGARFRREILSVGGIRPAADSFRAFRGRDPKLDALLRHHGMTEDDAQQETTSA
ncbi:M3 family metallopeptidase [Orrella marina]|uniref:oligopeptidase A n=1 Tax=Orrella marina TaxID=2163011 RepID=A0A2R4XPB3_9BURK|nr:M3 family metallopeptidase [Orrella marina]AWB35611.1 oligopeptidase A [Orrella marina]